MTTIFILIYIIILLLLVGVAAIVIESSELSEFELKRRAEDGDAEAKAILTREVVYGDLLSLQRVISSLLLVLAVVFGVVVFDWVWGVIVSVVVALEYGVVAQTPLIRSTAQKLYSRYESTLIDFISRQSIIMGLLRSISAAPKETHISSREELLHFVNQADIILTHDEKLLITSGLSFSSKTVESAMTPRSVIDSVKRSELLGPLVLDDLHKTGHSRLPVIDGDIDHVVGMLHTRDLLVIDSVKKHTPKVETVMESRVYYIREDQTLDKALAAFLKVHHHLFVVVNEYRETVGLLSLEDVIETLLGKKIIDEFDAHDDLRAVAEGNPRGNNKPPRAEDV
ncbi:MAG: CBS domain-containing protein [Candidatus Saccharimonadales bacterium]